MRISENGKNLIKKYEGCRLTAYYCPSGVLTIGWGHTGNVYVGQKISQEQADMLFDNDIKKYEVAERYGNFNQNQFDALTSFAYNCGVGALKSVCESGNIPHEMSLYVNGSNGKLEGLVRRRKEEVELYNTPCGSGFVEYAEEGHATVIDGELNIRNSPSLNCAIEDKYIKGESFVYDKVVINEGYVWTSYISYSGVRRYVASRKQDKSEIYLKCV